MPALGALGYVPGTRDPAALETLSIAYCLLPCALKLLATALLYFLLLRDPMKRRLLLTLAASATTALLMSRLRVRQNIASYRRPATDRSTSSSISTARWMPMAYSPTDRARWSNASLWSCNAAGMATTALLDEDFIPTPDGTKQKRVWRLKKTGEGRFVGRTE